jgi:hypothetical protein
MSTVALLLGMFGIPLAALWLGHRFRRLSPARRRVFWGLVCGYGIALIIVALALFIDPVYWGDPATLRGAITHWGLLLIPLGTALLQRIRHGQ